MAGIAEAEGEADKKEEEEAGEEQEAAGEEEEAEEETAPGREQLRVGISRNISPALLRRGDLRGEMGASTAGEEEEGKSRGDTLSFADVRSARERREISCFISAICLSFASWAATRESTFSFIWASSSDRLSDDGDSGEGSLEGERLVGEGFLGDLREPSFLSLSRLQRHCSIAFLRVWLGRSFRERNTLPVRGDLLCPGFSQLVIAHLS